MSQRKPGDEVSYIGFDQSGSMNGNVAVRQPAQKIDFPFLGPPGRSA